MLILPHPSEYVNTFVYLFSNKLCRGWDSNPRPRVFKVNIPYYDLKLYQLSYPGVLVAGVGLEPTTFGSMGPMCYRLLPPRNISSKKESNPRPTEYKTAALPTELLERIFTIKRLPNRQLALTYARDDYRCPPLPLHPSFTNPQSCREWQPLNHGTFQPCPGASVASVLLIRPVSGHIFCDVPCLRHAHASPARDMELPDGAEPPFAEYESAVLPLNYGSVYPVYSRKPT